MKILKFKQIICTPCKDLDIFLEHGLGVQPDETYVLDGDNDNDRDVAGEYGIMTTPVLVLVDDEGKELDRVVGNKNRDEIASLFAKRG